MSSPPFYRGLESTIPTLADGAPGFTTDTFKLYVGSSAGNKLIGPGAAGAHASTHQNGGADEISVAGLSGLLADAQTPLAHNQAFSTITATPTTLAGYGITDAQGLDPTLTAFAALTIAANSLTIGTGADAFSQTSFAANTFPARASTGNLVAKTITDFGLSLVDDADATAGRSTLGVVIGTNVQAWDADLDALAALTGTNTIYYRSAANTWTAVTIGTNLTFSAGTLSSSGGVSDGDKGAITVSSGGTVWNIDANAVMNANISQRNGMSVMGKASSATGDVDDIIAGTDGHVLRRSGSTLGFGTIATAGIADSAITTAKIAADAVTQRSQSETAGVASTSSTTYADLESVTITTTGGDVLVIFNCDVYGNAAASSIQFRLRMDTTVQGIDPKADLAFAAGSDVTRAGVQYLISAPSAASHAFTIQYKAGAGTINARNRTLTVIEFKR